MLVLRDVRSGYGSIEVLHGIDLAVPEGAVVAVLGANGAGKTTLLKTVAGVVPMRHGQAAFDGTPLSSLDAAARARAGLCLIPEGRGIFRQLSVYENVAAFVRGRDVPAAFERAVAAFPKLGERRTQQAGTLSGGEQQMLAVSRALISEPRLVMADELSVGLSPLVVDEIYEAISALRDSGVSLLIVEQYVERVLGLADYVYFLRKGAVAHVGRPDDYRDPALLDRLHLATGADAGADAGAGGVR